VTGEQHIELVDRGEHDPDDERYPERPAEVRRAAAVVERVS
jgi:hypothetical protein